MNDKSPEFGESRLIPMKLIVTENRGRKQFKAIPSLMDSIEKDGLIHPLVVAPWKDEKFILVAGERRLRAMTLLEFVEVPCVIKTIPPSKQKKLELMENIQRDNLEWSERITIRDQLHELLVEEAVARGEKWNMTQTAEVMGTSFQTVQREIQVEQTLKRRPDIKARVKDLPFSLAARTIKKIEETEEVERKIHAGLIKMDSRIKCGDCILLLKELSNESVDLIVTDPPFANPVITQQAGQDQGEKGVGFYQLLEKLDNMDRDSFRALMKIVIPELSRVMKPCAHIYFFFTIQEYTWLRSQFNKAGIETSAQPIIWDKGHQTAPFRGLEPASCYEVILFGHKKPRTKHLNSPCTYIERFPPVSSTKKRHPFEKPLELLETFIKRSSIEGELVLDPFAGSGVTLIAAKRLNRVGLGFEKSEKRFAEAQVRIQDAESLKPEIEKPKTGNSPAASDEVDWAAELAKLEAKHGEKG